MQFGPIVYRLFALDKTMNPDVRSDDHLIAAILAGAESGVDFVKAVPMDTSDDVLAEALGEAFGSKPMEVDSEVDSDATTFCDGMLDVDEMRCVSPVAPEGGIDTVIALQELLDKITGKLRDCHSALPLDILMRPTQVPGRPDLVMPMAVHDVYHFLASVSPDSAAAFHAHFASGEYDLVHLSIAAIPLDSPQELYAEIMSLFRPVSGKEYNCVLQNWAMNALVM